MPGQWEDPEDGPISVYLATGQKPRGESKEGRD